VESGLRINTSYFGQKQRYVTSKTPEIINHKQHERLEKEKIFVFVRVFRVVRG